jgi:primosomal protein N' (replication factor Y)
MGGRRARGFVTAVFDAPADRELVAIDAAVGSIPSFGADDLAHLRWCATHYVAPLSVILRRTVPPNVPRGARTAGSGVRATSHAITQVVTPPPYHQALGEFTHTLRASGASVMVIAPTVAEVEELATNLRAEFGDAVVLAHSSLSAKDATSAWVRAATTQGLCIVGTREVAAWPVAGLGGIGVIEDARPAMRSPSTPTLGVRETIVDRARRADLPVLFVSPLPSLEVLALHPTVVARPGRQWPLVEIADRNEEPPTASPVLDRTRAAIAAMARRAEPSFVLVPRRGYAATIVCTSCGALRRCGTCGGAVIDGDTCPRCGASIGACTSCGGSTWRPIGAGRGNVIEDLRRVVGDQVGDREAGRLVTVGTERDLVGVREMALTVAIDIDGAALAPNYRAGEDALRLLVRLADTLERRRGRRCLVQTSDPHLPAIEAFRSGDPARFIEGEQQVRKKAGFPPYGELIALEVTWEGEARDVVTGALDGLAIVRGPARVADADRWLIHGRDLSGARLALRDVVRSLRDRGAKVRVDVDPHEL